MGTKSQRGRDRQRAGERGGGWRQSHHLRRAVPLQVSEGDVVVRTDVRRIEGHNQGRIEVERPVLNTGEEYRPDR